MIASIIKLMRPNQYYKNILIGIGIVFSENLLNYNYYPTIFIGFVTLCIMSSMGYIINDIIDKEHDLNHPKKSTRPIAAGIIGVNQAYVLMFILNLFVIGVTFIIEIEFVILAYFLLISTILYSIIGKNLPIIDLILISINFVIRAISGCILISVSISPWLIICSFLFAFYLATGKRYGDLKILGNNAKRHKIIYEHYTEEYLTMLLIISSSCLILAFSIYAVNSPYDNFIYLLPIFIYFILFYLLNLIGHDMGSNPASLLMTKEILSALILMSILGILIIYIF